LKKKEMLGLSREKEKLERALGGIKEIKKLPDAIFFIDPKLERIAVLEVDKSLFPSPSLPKARLPVEHTAE